MYACDRNMNVAITVATCTLLLEQAWCASTVEINGAGASFPFDVYSAWMPAYKAARRPFRHVTMKYDSIGSGGGKARIKVSLSWFWLSPLTN